MRISISIGVLIAQCCFVGIYATTKSAMRFSLRGNTGQMVTSDTLAWQTFVAEDPKQMEFAVEAAKFHTEQDKYPIYVCRVTVEGVVITGHTEKHETGTVCTASMHTVKNHRAFDVLLNKGDAAKLTWTKWRKISPAIPIGAVSASSDGHVSTYLAEFSTRTHINRT